MKARLFSFCVIIHVITACHQHDADPHPILVLNSNSAFVISLSWSKVPSAQGYKIWRSFTGPAGNSVQPPEVIATVDANTLTYADKALPIASSVEYYVTATSGDIDIKSNVISTPGHEVLDLLPYQMALMPDRHRAVVRTAKEIVVLNYETGTIFRRLPFTSALGTFALAKRNGAWELYVPCADGKVYICDAADPVILETVSIGAPVASVAVNSKGWIAVSSADLAEPIKIYRRELLTKIGGITDFQNLSAQHLLFRSDYNLFVASPTTLLPAMRLYILNEQAAVTDRINGPTDQQYSTVGELVNISFSHAVATHSGLVFSMPDLSYQTTLVNGGKDQIDFQFSEDGNTVYAATSAARNIIKSTITDGKVTSTKWISTTGYPWLMCRDGSNMIVLSSPEPFTTMAPPSQVFMETVSLE